MNKAGVEISPSIRIGAIGHVPEGVHPMRVVQVGVKAKNLPKACFAVTKKGFWETGLFPNPIMTGKGRQRGTESRRAHRDRRIRAWSAGT